MLSIAHMATGGIVAQYLPNPIIYIPIILSLHLVEDAVPHWDCGTGMGKTQTKLKAILCEIVDLLASVIFVYITFNIHNPHVWIGAIIGIVPDLIEAPQNFLNLHLPLIEPLNKLHEKFHNSTTNVIVGLLPQFVLLFVIYLLS